jgi:pimeloyl-ACP methyl ester carboxylesterase
MGWLEVLSSPFSALSESVSVVHMIADLDDIRLYYESHGEGYPVVLVHGLGLSTDMWQHQVPALAARYRVITFDNRGHGRSDKPPGPYGLAMFVEDTRRLLDFLELKSVVLIGLSMGGGIVQAFTLKHPERVRSLVLISTSSERSPQRGTSFFRNAEIAEREGMGALAAPVVPFWFAPASLEQRTGEVDRIRQTFLANDARAWAASARANGNRESLTPRLGEIACPVLYIGGALDGPAPRQSEIYAAHLPNVEVHLLPGVAHLLCLEVPDQVNTLLLGFLQRIGTLQ